MISKVNGDQKVSEAIKQLKLPVTAVAEETAVTELNAMHDYALDHSEKCVEK